LPITASFGQSAICGTGGTSCWVGQAPVDVSNSRLEAGFLRASSAEPNDHVHLHLVAPAPPAFLSQAWSYPNDSAVRTSLALSHDVAYFADDAGTVTTPGVQNSQPVWTTAETSAIDSTPALGGIQVFFGTRAAPPPPLSVGLRTADGTLIWSTPTTTSAVESSPAVSGLPLYLGTDDRTLYDMNIKIAVGGTARGFD